MKNTQTVNGKKKKNTASIEQMCGILLLLMQENINAGLKREFEGMLKSVRAAEPSKHLEIRRIDKYIINNLRLIQDFVKAKETNQKILELTAETGLLLLQRSLKVGV